MAGTDPFDPIAVLQALDEHRVRYIVVGALARVIHGSDELMLTSQIEICFRDLHCRVQCALRAENDLTRLRRNDALAIMVHRHDLALLSSHSTSFTSAVLIRDSEDYEGRGAVEGIADHREFVFVLCHDSAQRF